MLRFLKVQSRLAVSGSVSVADQACVLLLHVKCVHACKCMSECNPNTKMHVYSHDCIEYFAMAFKKIQTETVDIVQISSSC